MMPLPIADERVYQKDERPVYPRVAYFPDSFHEVNGVAHTSRNFAAFAKRQGLPMLCVRAGQKTRLCKAEGSVRALELGRSPLAVQLERDLYFDPLFFRYSNTISETVRSFRPEVIHITGPSELGIFGAYFAWQLKIPLVASWHTNVHEYAARRMTWLTRRLSARMGRKVEEHVEDWTLDATSWFYRLAKVLYAPNPGLCSLLEKETGRPCHLMQRGVETDVFSPVHRTRAKDDREIVLGFVGRLSVEKNVALLPKVDAALRERGINAKWLIVGHGSEDEMLRGSLKNVTMAGVLRGEALAEAYANMDVFVFPSHTDTFGNVVLEALASGVPAVVTPNGGPATIVRDGETGRVARDEEFAAAIVGIVAAPEQMAAMRAAAREHAMQCSWDAVFSRVVAEYPRSLVREQRLPAEARTRVAG
ncbi:glycosyltransferase [Granulicella sp. 5B5]|uniref:glycosyltransferase n=1 Tax=Granulicella sp. 5B5 TaxID=1617967 RepID=UPI00175C6BB7|nr:glycosyltransferase [Granulicella sp. 5B5]QMV18962.1 glycosyltransferase [Granulicella sp. 5B5]